MVRPIAQSLTPFLGTFLFAQHIDASISVRTIRFCLAEGWSYRDTNSLNRFVSTKI